jgi:hexokinase
MPPISSLDLVSSESWRQRSELSSMASLPPELDSALSALDQQFWVPTSKLQDIVSRFREELKEGLQKEGGNIPMNMSWVLGMPSGKERGVYLAIDLGGTNLRVCRVELFGDGEKDGVDEEDNRSKGKQKENANAKGPHGKHSLLQEQYKLPTDLKTGSADQLWTFITSKISTFLSSNGLDKEYSNEDGKRMPLGFTFSYPATQHRIDHGILQTWTKGFDIDGVEGEDVSAQFRSHIEKRGLPVELVCLINDTVGAMIASAYNDPETIIGAIFGTGCNAAYMQSLIRNPPSIPKLELRDEEWDALDKNGGGEKMKMAINCEYGAFDNAHRVLPRTKFDETVDRESPRPGEQTFEKLSAGLYLGEIFRLVVLGLVDSRLVFKEQDVGELKKPYVVDTGFLSRIEDDESHKFQKTRDLFKDTLHLEPSDPEIELCRRLAELIAVRGARLCACGIAAICLNEGIEKGHVAADGSVANKHPKFKRRWAKALGEILNWSEQEGTGDGGEAVTGGKEGEGEGGNDGPIKLTSAEDGSGVGVAVIAAMALERAEKGLRIGMGG